MTPQASEMTLNVDTSKAFSSDLNLMDFSQKSENGMLNMSSAISPSTTEFGKDIKVPNITATPAQTQSQPRQQLQVGPLPEPKPDIIMAQTGSSQQQQDIPVDTSPSTDVPLINSSNPDNFYVLYSQLQYNVVT